MTYAESSPLAAENPFVYDIDMQTFRENVKNHRRLYTVLLLLTVFFFAIRVFPLFQDREPVFVSEKDLAPYHDGNSYAVPDLILDRGIYTVQVASHGLEVMQFSIDGYSDGSWYRLSSAITETPIDLAFGQTSATQRIMVSENDIACRLRLLKSESGDGILQLPLSVSFYYRPMQSAFVFAVYTITPFLVLFCFLFLFFHFADKNDRSGEWMILAYTLLLFILSIPVLRNNVPQGNDLVFHVSRIASMAEELARGQIPVRIGSSWFKGYGTPVDVFYGELFLFIPSLLHMGGLPAWQCYNLAVVLNHLMLLVFSHLCFSELTGKRSAGICCTILYATAYRYFYNMYPDAAFGEATGMAFYPLIILGFYRLFTGEEERPYRCVLPLIAGFSGLIQSHVISLFQAVLFAAVFCAVRIRDLLQEHRLRTLLLAALGTGLLNLWFLLPFLDYYLRHDVQAQNVTSIIRDASMEPVWLLTNRDEGSVGLSVICLLFLGIYLVYKMERSKTRNRLIVLAGMSAGACFMATRWMPWHWLELHLTPLYSLLGGKIEFATRYLSPATALICTLGALCMRYAPEILPEYRQVLRYAVAALTVWSLTQSIAAVNAFDDYNTAFRARMTDPDITAASEPSYMFQDLNWLDFYARERTNEALLVKPDGSSVPVETSRNGLTFVCSVHNTFNGAVNVDFPVFNYHGMIAEDESGRLPVSDNEERCVRVTVPEGYEGTITVRFSEPWYWRVAELISVAALFAGIILYRRRFRSRTTSSR